MFNSLLDFLRPDYHPLWLALNLFTVVVYAAFFPRLRRTETSRLFWLVYWAFFSEAVLSAIAHGAALVLGR